MVLMELITMSKSSAVDQGPPPPTVEQILEDLKAASKDDVVFKPPPLPSVEEIEAKANVQNIGSTTEECSSQYSSARTDVKESTEKMADGKVENQSHDQLYDKMKSFLDHYQALVTSQEVLKGFEGSLCSKKQQLQESIDRVKEAWKVEKGNS